MATKDIQAARVAFIKAEEALVATDNRHPTGHPNAGGVKKATWTAVVAARRAYKAAVTAAPDPIAVATDEAAILCKRREQPLRDMAHAIVIAAREAAAAVAR